MTGPGRPPIGPPLKARLPDDLGFPSPPIDGSSGVGYSRGMTNLRNDIDDYPVTIGASVKRVEGRPENVGRRGVVSAIHGTVAGDTLITVNGGTAAEWQAYTRQVKVTTR